MLWLTLYQAWPKVLPSQLVSTRGLRVTIAGPHLGAARVMGFQWASQIRPCA